MYFYIVPLELYRTYAMVQYINSVFHFCSKKILFFIKHTFRFVSSYSVQEVNNSVVLLLSVVPNTHRFIIHLSQVDFTMCIHKFCGCFSMGSSENIALCMLQVLYSQNITLA